MAGRGKAAGVKGAQLMGKGTSQQQTTPGIHAPCWVLCNMP